MLWSTDCWEWAINTFNITAVMARDRWVQYKRPCKSSSDYKGVWLTSVSSEQKNDETFKFSWPLVPEETHPIEKSYESKGEICWMCRMCSTCQDKFVSFDSQEWQAGGNEGVLQQMWRSGESERLMNQWRLGGGWAAHHSSMNKLKQRRRGKKRAGARC